MGLVVPAAASTAALASTRPAPQSVQVLGKARALAFRRVSTSSGVSAEFLASISATTPATCGVAMEVPWYQA